MNKLQKISLIVLIWLLTLFLISVVQLYPLPILLNTASFSQIPLIYWIVILASPPLLYLIAKDSENPFVPLFCVIFYFFIFYSIGLYYISHPTISDIGSSGRGQAILSSLTHIGPRAIDPKVYVSEAQYFRWPIFFFFSKIFTTILGIGPLLTINLGFFSLLFVIPIILSSMIYKNSKKNNFLTLYFILPGIYLTLCWHFINDQFVPQFLSLVYLFILFGCYLKYRKERNSIYLLLTIIFYSLTVFSHPFVFIFFLVPIIVELGWSEYVETKSKKIFSYGLMIIFFAILFPYYGTFYSLASTTPGGESWRIIQQFFSQSNNEVIGETGPKSQLLYHLIPQILDEYFSSSVKIILFASIAVVAFGLILFILKKRSTIDLSKRSLFDLNILIGSAAWFVMGLANLVLGQRALQVAAIPLAKYFQISHKYLSFLSRFIIIVILVAPSLFIANDMINTSLEGDRLIQDYEENIAGRFIDEYLSDKSYLLSAQNPYPTGYLSNFTGVGLIDLSGYKITLVNTILKSPKLQKRALYNNVELPSSKSNSTFYSNQDIEIIYLYK